MSLWGRHALAHVTADGELTVHDVLRDGDEPHGVAVGPDRRVWTALESGALAVLDTA